MARRSNSLIRRAISISLIIAIAIGLTLFSLRYKQPANCQELCTGPQPCQVGQCKFGEQSAGFPFPFIRDAEGGSPPSGWGKVGLEDYMYANPRAFTFDVAFYSLTLWLFQRLIRWLLHSFQGRRAEWNTKAKARFQQLIAKKGAYVEEASGWSVGGIGYKCRSTAAVNSS
jgi:hypothetical protein